MFWGRAGHDDQAARGNHYYHYSHYYHAFIHTHNFAERCLDQKERSSLPASLTGTKNDGANSATSLTAAARHSTPRNTLPARAGQSWSLGAQGAGAGAAARGGGGQGQPPPPPHGRRHLCLFLSTGGVGRLRVSRGGSGEWGKRRVAARRREVPVFGAWAWGSRIKMREQMSKKGASSVVGCRCSLLELGFGKFLG